MNLKETCAMTDSEWEERQKARQEEIQACSEALAILSSDDAHDTFTKTFNFAQVKVSKTGKERRANAANVLLAAARASHNPQLAALAAHACLDAFTKVKAAIDDMQTQLKRAGEDRELENKDFQATVADQRETQKLLNSALNVLKAVYAKKFLQVSSKQKKQEPV